MKTYLNLNREQLAKIAKAVESMEGMKQISKKLKHIVQDKRLNELELVGPDQEELNVDDREDEHFAGTDMEG